MVSLGPVAGVAAVAAMLCAGAAGWLAGGGRDEVGRRARELSGAPERATWRARWRRAGRWSRGRIGREAWCLPAGLGVGVVGESVVPVLASLAAAFVVRRWLAARGAERERDRRTAAVIGLCAAVAGELRAGQQPHRALLAAGLPGLGDEGAAVSAAARYGGDVPQALRTAARLPGADGLTGMAACWQVAVQGGAGLASGLERIAAGLRARRDQQEELRAQLAGPRVTALMLALLPAAGLLMGGALGADPLRVLLHTPSGWVCLVAGGLLEWGGVAWTARIVAEASEGGDVRWVR
ncbi:type II secretion system F family protein [Streptomyces sp. NPDC053427]|uniref:type II secretion system F family protein n=1 Tax=Streptomyces sp. NPDC053427 TaxID=3365701 RepID=UPI0037CE5C1F